MDIKELSYITFGDAFSKIGGYFAAIAGLFYEIFLPFIIISFILKLCDATKHRFSIVYREELMETLVKYQELVSDTQSILPTEETADLERRYDEITTKFLNQEGLTNNIRLSANDLNNNDESNIYNQTQTNLITDGQDRDKSEFAKP